MSRKLWCSVLSIAVALACAAGAYADFATPVIKKWTEKEKNDKGQEIVIHYMTINGIMVHETDPRKQPPPPVITPGTASTERRPGRAPSDAIVLFDGKDLSKWTSTSITTPTKWIVKDRAMEPTPHAGYIRTKQEFGSCQLHLEWAEPKKITGIGQGRGNSGVFFMGRYEVQILDSYHNLTYPDGQCGALYGRAVPLVNACRKPGQWQTYDIIFHRPFFKDGKVVKRATFTVFQNGVLIQDHVELSGGTGWLGGHAVTDYVPHGDTGPLELQYHGNTVRFRNIWIRKLKD